ncbi:hypothetical protein CROQUDRAFT_42346 [Cronartium quercuum f. sp. fusiforme G11]|uniref:Glycosyl transferase CAP10 domain-containing protein n=1 Tax=Cronartium quercuum f. sp. fusiforme G11 TaxID=708437 RepID=A0A9P6NP90_9BASI|nr:hypothetical protein CROQUDRAFT_42346 [Cronartium quercuum f. sp. fusiforme G11]
MAILRRRSLFFLFLLAGLFSLLFLLYPHYFASSTDSYAYINVLHDRLYRTFGLFPDSSTLQALVPQRFKWSNWQSEDLDRLEDSLLDANRTSPPPTLLPLNNTLITDNTPLTLTRPELVYHPNGYYLLPKDQPLKPHPIHTLIARAEKEWNEKLARNSKSLRECVAEYKRRYRRPPPFGFERWWQYAIKEGVILKDEYDQIDRDFRPFLALEPEDLKHRSSVMANERPQTFTLTVKAGAKVVVSGPEKELQRATDLAALINRFGDMLPASGKEGFNLTFTLHDQPAVQMTNGRKQKMLDLADRGEYLSPSDYIQPPNPNLSNWANACPPSSALYLNETGKSKDAEAGRARSFVYEHVRAMDVCEHPESKLLHGFTASPGADISELVPLFTFAKTTTQSDVLVTPLEQFSDTYNGDDPAWSAKKYDRLLWRGSTTGAEFMKGVEWQSSQRARLHITTHQREGHVKVLVESKDGSAVVEEYDLGELNRRIMDTSFSGGPVQCDPETCKYMRGHLQFADTMGLNDSLQYKYLIDLDGNGWSGRFHRLMSSNSLVLKSTIFPEWYAQRVQPWIHYVPIKVDYSDLYDVMVFFVGDQKKIRGQDHLAEKIATAGKAWAGQHWRRVDMAAYMFRLVLEWRRVVLRGTGEVLDYLLVFFSFFQKFKTKEWRAIDMM